MIDVQMGEHDALDVCRRAAERLQLRACLLLRLDAEADAQRK